MAVQQIMTQIGLRRKLYEEMEPSATTGRKLSFINLCIVALVILSFLTLALETEDTLSPLWRQAVNVANLVIIAIFALEYLVRLWIAGEDPKYKGVTGRIRYIFTPYAIFDLVAFLPELLFLLFAPVGSNEHLLMVLRVLRLARLIKIARFVPAFDVLGATMQRAGKQLLTTVALALVLVYIAAVALYFIEGVGVGREEFASIPRAIWWAVATLTTVGYGDIYPVTALGRFAASIIAIAGIGLVALPAGVFASAFSDELRSREDRKRQEEAESYEQRTDTT